MDIFSNQRSFFIKGQPVYYTALGGCFTIIIFILALLFFLYLSSAWLLKEHHLINEFQMFNDDTVGWDTSAKIMISYPKSIENKFFFFRDFSYKQELEKFHNCSLQEYFMYYETPQNSSLVYKCGEIIAPGYYDHTVYAVNCSYFKKYNLLIESPNCSEDPNVEEIDFEYLIYTHRYNTLSEPGKISKYILKNRDLKISNNLKVFFTFNKLVEYDYFDNINQINYFTDIINEAPSSRGSEIIFSIEATKDDGNLSYLSNLQIEVKKKKLQEISAMVFVLFNILFTICFYINNVINDFQMRKYILSLIVEDIDLIMIANEMKEEIQKKKKGEFNFSTVEFITKTYTLTNDFRLKFRLFLSKDTKKLLKLVNEKITQKISIEKIQGKDFEFCNNSNNSTGFWGKISGFLELCDFLAPGISFIIKKKKKFSTFSGELFTLIYILGLIALFYFFGSNFWYQIPRLSQYQADNYSDKHLFNHDIPAMIYFPKEILPYYNISYFNRTIAKMGLTNFSSCETSDFERFNKIPNENYSYFCDNVQNYFTINEEVWEDVYISLTKCNELIKAGFNNTGCLPYNFEENPKKFRDLIIGIVFLSKTISLHEPGINPKNIINERNYTLPFIFDQDSIEYDFHFAQQEINNCQGLFFCQFENHRYSTFYNNSVFYYFSDLNNTVDFYFRFHIHLTWTRDYIKVYEILAQVMSLAKLIWMFLYICNIFLENYFFFKLFRTEFLQKHLKFHKLPKQAQENLKILIGKNECIDLKTSEMTLKSSTFPNVSNLELQNLMKTKIITFKNYVIYRIFGTTFNPFLFNIYEAIYQEMISCCSFETTLRVKFDTSNQKIERFFSNFDFISENRLIHYKKSNKYLTWIGGILSLAKIVLIILLLIFFGFDFWYKKNPRLTTYTAKFYELNPEDFTMSIPIMIYYQKNLSDYLFFSNEDFAGDKKLTKNFGMWDCTKNDTNFFNIPVSSELISKCSNANKVLNFDYKNLGSIEGNFRLVDCYVAEGWNSLESSECNITSTSEFYKVPKNFTVHVGYKFNITKFNQDDPYNPVFSEWIELDRVYSMYNLPKAEYDIRNSLLFDDHGWIVPDSKSYTYTSLININNKPYMGAGMLIAFTFVTPDVMIIRRQYMRFPELLANVFAMINVVNAGLLLIYMIINNYLLYSDLGKNVRRKKNCEKVEKVNFLKFFLGHSLKITKWNQNYKNLSAHYEDIFTFEKILSSGIDERFMQASKFDKKNNILEIVPLAVEEDVRLETIGSPLETVGPLLNTVENPLNKEEEEEKEK